MLDKILLTVGILLYGVVVPYLEINDTHVFNPACCSRTDSRSLAAVYQLIAGKYQRCPVMKCRLVDVFARQKFRGNGLTIFYDFESLNEQEMLVLTQEMRQFESIFLSGSPGNWSARIFTTEEELEFAGHPLLGLAYHLHQSYVSGRTGAS